MALKLITVALALSVITACADARQSRRVMHVKVEELSQDVELSLTTKGEKGKISASQLWSAVRPRHMQVHSSQLEPKQKVMVEKVKKVKAKCTKNCGAKAAIKKKTDTVLEATAKGSEARLDRQGFHVRTEDRSGSTSQSASVAYYPLQRELHAVGLAAGACMGGMDPNCVYFLGCVLILLTALAVSARRLSRVQRPKLVAPCTLQPVSPSYCVKAVDVQLLETV